MSEQTKLREVLMALAKAPKSMSDEEIVALLSTGVDNPRAVFQLLYHLNVLRNIKGGGGHTYYKWQKSDNPRQLVDIDGEVEEIYNILLDLKGWVLAEECVGKNATAPVIESGQTIIGEEITTMKITKDQFEIVKSIEVADIIDYVKFNGIHLLPTHIALIKATDRYYITFLQRNEWPNEDDEFKHNAAINLLAEYQLPNSFESITLMQRQPMDVSNLDTYLEVEVNLKQHGGFGVANGSDNVASQS